jgi:PAS domain S-box-containing protein
MSGRNILIVEDSQTQADILKFLLEKGGYIVNHCHDGKQALASIRSVNPDLVISDIIMPEMNGYELCKRIKHDPEKKEIPVLLLTSLADAEDIIIGLECGADNYLMKPYDENLLIDRVQSMLKNNNSSSVSKEEHIYDMVFEGKKYKMKSSREKILDMMVSVYEAAVQKTRKLQETQRELNKFKSSLKLLVLERTSDLSEKIEQRRTIEESIKRSERHYRNLIESAMLGVFQANEKGDLEFLNSSLLELLGYSDIKDVLGKSFKIFFPEQNEFNSLIEILEENKKVYNYEVEFIGNSGKRIWAILNLLINNGQISGFIIDINERKAAEEKEKHYQEALKAMKESAEESDREKSVFLSNISHDIKNPLNAITGFSSLLNDPYLTKEKSREYHFHIIQNTKLLSSLINNILDLSRFEASKIQLHESKCKLNVLMDELLVEFENNRRLLKREKVRIVLEKANSKGDFTVSVDQDRLRQVISNLLDNSLKFTMEGSIRFGYEIHKEEFLFFVKDTGPGIPKKDMNRVISRFQKTENLQFKQTGGAGLGLTLSNHLVNMMKGSLWIQSEYGDGTEVYFNIKLDEKDSEEQLLNVKPEQALTTTLSGKHILVADDNETNFILIKAYLEATGAELSWARDGEYAVELCRKRSNFDMVLMDLQMPRMDGFEATSEIRVLRPELPVVAVTAYSRTDIIGKAKKAGFDGYLKKPVSQNDLLDTISTNLFKPQ